MDDLTILMLFIIIYVPLCLFALFLDRISARKNKVLLEYIDYLEKQLCTRNSDKDLLKRIFILKRQNKYIIDTADREIKDYKKVLKGE